MQVTEIGTVIIGTFRLTDECGYARLSKFETSLMETGMFVLPVPGELPGEICYFVAPSWEVCLFPEDQS